MAEKKSILEEALLDIKNIQGALNANTREILRSVTREEIDGVVKESLMEKEADYEEEDLEGPSVEEPTGDFPVEEPANDEMSDDSVDGLDDIESSEEVAPEMEPELGMDTDVLGGDEMDMTASSDDDVIAIYKKLSGEDEIEIVGDEIHLNVAEPGEYVVKMNNTGTGMDTEVPADDLGLDAVDDVEVGADDEDGVDYEIEMGDEEETPELETGDETSGDEDVTEPTADDDEKEELEEQIPVGSAQAHHLQPTQTKGVPLGAGADNLKESVIAKKLVSETTKKYNSLLTEATKLKAENDEFRAALKEFRSKLVETVVFNSNLTYVVRLLSEHTVSKKEKQSIINRFDEQVTNLIESKKLYKTIANELESRTPINETIENKIIKEASTSSSKQLNESTAYVDPSTKRIMDLIKRVEKR